MRKRQRTWSAGRKRSSNPKVDLGTSEAITKRLALVPNAPALSTCPIDVLLAREDISREAHSAAMHWAELRRLIFGLAHPRAVNLNRIGGVVESMETGEINAQYMAGADAMRAASPQSLIAVESLVVHEKVPEWMRTGETNTLDRRMFSRGLAALVGWYRNRD